MNNKHTPTPWHFGVSDDPDAGPKPYTYSSGMHADNPGILSQDGVTVVGCGEYNVFNSPEDAEFIVRACNAYDELLAELKQAHVEITEAAKIIADSYPRLSSFYHLAADRIKAAIAKAEGKANA